MEDMSRYYTLLRDPARRKIVEFLGTQEKIGFKELREALDLGVGTVYYHLDMLSDFITQDKQRKYRLNDRGQMLYKVLKNGNVHAILEISETFSHRIGKWLFLSPIFAKTVKPSVILPFSIAILLIGAFGSAYVNLDPALFFYFPYSSYEFSSIMTLYIFNCTLDMDMVDHYIIKLSADSSGFYMGCIVLFCLSVHATGLLRHQNYWWTRTLLTGHSTLH